MALLMNLVKEPSHWRLSVHGNLEFGECHQFQMTADRILASKPHATVLDLRNLGRLDQAGLGRLIAMSHEHTETGRQLVIVTSTPFDLLCDARLEDIFSTAQTMESAVGMLNHPIQVNLHGALSAG